MQSCDVFFFYYLGPNPLFGNVQVQADKVIQKFGFGSISPHPLGNFKFLQKKVPQTIWDSGWTPPPHLQNVTNHTSRVHVTFSGLGKFFNLTMQRFVVNLLFWVQYPRNLQCIFDEFLCILRVFK